MDEVTQKMVDGTAWRGFCDLLADAGEVVLADGNSPEPSTAPPSSTPPPSCVGKWRNA